MTSPTVIVVVTYQSARFLPPLFESLARHTPKGSYQVWLIDNASTDDSVTVARREAARLDLPLRIEVMPRNLGFTGGNNAAYARLKDDPEWRTLVLLNPDTEVHPGWLPPLEAALRNQGVGTASAWLILPDGTLNSRGNQQHFLGFGFVDGLGEPVVSSLQHPVFFGTGAALAIARHALKNLSECGAEENLFWDRLGMYGEDVDLGWRMRMAGFENVVVPDSRVTHHYVFVADRPDTHRLALVERNRWLVLLSNYRWATLLLILPALLGLELLLCLGWKKRLLGARLPVMREVVRAWDAAFWQRRRRLQQSRRAKDRAILACMTGYLNHGALKSSPGLKMANTLAHLYLEFVRGIVWW